MKNLVKKVTNRLQRGWLNQLSLDAIQRRLAQRPGVLTLCYHSLSADLDDYRWRTQAAAFDNHLRFLRETFDVLPCDEAVHLLMGGMLDRRTKPVAVICFDDGYRDNWTIATPILEKHNAPAMLFAARDLVLRSSATHMDEPELVALAKHPLWTIGAHAVTHNPLTSLREEDQNAEMRDCKHWLTDLLGQRPAAFAYPQGQISESLVKLTGQHFDYAFSTDVRLGAQFDKFQIRRHCPVQEEDQLGAFARSLVTAPMETAEGS